MEASKVKYNQTWGTVTEESTLGGTVTLQQLAAHRFIWQEKAPQNCTHCLAGMALEEVLREFIGGKQCSKLQFPQLSR